MATMEQVRGETRGIYHEHLGSTDGGHHPTNNNNYDNNDNDNRHPYSSSHQGAHESTTHLAAAGAPMAGVAMEPQRRYSTIPPAKKKWYKTRNFIICQIVSIIILIILIFVLLFPVVRAIAQHVINVSVINIDSAAISLPQNGSFALTMNGIVTHTGFIPATIHYTEPVNVSWAHDGIETPLGYMSLDQISSKHKRATLNQTTNFVITDESAFGQFTAAMITQKNFTWVLSSKNLRVNAVKFPVAKDITFKKNVVMNGIDNFNGNVKLLEFLLPQDDPNGGITFSATTSLNNPSPFHVDLGDTVFNLTYQGVFLGLGRSNNTQIAPGTNNITLAGHLVSHANASSDLAQLGTLFTAYINGENSPVVASGVSTLQPNGGDISWLSIGLQSLKLDVPFQAPAPINPIQGIDIGFFDLKFSDTNPWAPVASTNKVQATMKLPFGFSVNISEIQNTFAINVNGSNVANLTTPIGASVSDIKVLSSTDTEGTINITIQNTPLNVPDDMHDAFAAFNTELTNSQNAQFNLIGSTSAKAVLAIGEITLNPIKFNVTSGLLGLRGLQGDTTIESVDVMGGTTDHIMLDIDLNIFNPSNLNLAVGDLDLQLFKDGSLLGTTLLPNLTLNMGNNSLKGVGSFQPNLDAQGQQTLNDFVAGKDTTLQISGYDKSTNVTSLLEAFESLHISAVLPGLNASLLKSASLTVLPTTGKQNNLAHVQVALANPFSGGLTITSISSSVTSHGINLGSINQTTSFPAAGKKTTTSPALNLNMNLDPSSVFSLLRALAVEAGLGTDQVDTIMQLGGYQLLSTTNADSKKRFVNAKRNAFTGFNLPNFVDAAFKKLKSDVQLSSAVSIGDYATQLQFTQASVPVATDESLNLLLPILAQPIVQKIVSGSALGIETVLITDPAENSFGTTLTGSISNAGPFDAKITFGSGLTISWNGAPLGKIAMPPVDVVGDVGAALNTKGTFQVADVNHLTDFTKTLLTEENFDWEITGDNLTVDALGISVTGISLPSKKVTLKGMNGLKNGVVINSFDLPANDPAGGIHLTLNTTVTNPADVGVALSSIGFQNFIGSTNLGPAVSTSAFTMAPKSTFNLPLVGRLIPQTSTDGLATVSQVFTDFIHGKSSNVTVHGASAGPSGVSWLNNAITQLQIETVLPSRGPLNVIQSISLDELKLLFTPETAYSPSTSSNAATASFQLPFAFPLDIVAVEQTITTSFKGQNFATLNIPKGPSKTDIKNRIIHLTFENVPFAVQDDAHGVFQQFLAETTASETETFALSGSANTDAQTAVGLLNIQQIGFSNLQTSIAGLQNLNVKPAVVSNLDVNHGFPDFLLIKVDTQLFNPSNLSIGIGDVAFNLDFAGQTIGQADISNLLVVPGSSNYSTDVHYAPTGGAQSSGQQLLENFIQGVVSDTKITGSTDTTTVDSLKPALAQIQLSASIPALHQNLITSTHIVFPSDIVQTGTAQATFSLSNPFTASINLLQVSTTAIFQNITLGTINVNSPNDPIHAAGHSNVTSPTLPLKFNLDPLAIISLLNIRAQQKHIDLGPLPQLFQIALANPQLGANISSHPDLNASTCNSGKQFDVNSAILNALAGLEVDLAINSTVKLDDFSTQLNFGQHGVPAITDQSALFLIGAVANPVSQALVNNAQLSFKTANITNLSDQGFDLALQGSLIDTGPLDALIEFTEPVTVTWQGRNIATIVLPPVCAAANIGVPNYVTSGRLTITDLGAFTDFAKFLLHNEEFDWVISTKALRVTALGNVFEGVSLSKTVSFKAFNGLPGVTISNFQLPSDSPQGGITISTDSMIPSSAQLGIELGTVGFEASFKGVELGPLSGSNFFLAADSVTKLHLDGRMVPQSGDALNTLGTLFSNFLAGQNQTLQVTGVSVNPNGDGPAVSWLSTAFQTLTLNVILPGQKFDIIQSITINDLELVMTNDAEAFAPLASSKDTLATYKNPFGFSLQVIESAQDITIAFNGVNAAQLNLPSAPADGGVSTGNVAPLQLSFQNQALKAVDNGAFEAFFAQATDKQSADTELKGSADVTAKTAVGNIPISGIPFDVKTSLAGINSFDGKADLSNVKITGSGGAGGSEFIIAPLSTVLNNPSNISLNTVDIALPVIYKGVQIGRSAIDTFNLIPGQNTFNNTEFHYEPADANDTTAQSFLTAFIQESDPVPISIKGDSGSSPFGSLQSALEGVNLDTSVQGTGTRLVTQVNVIITLDTFLTNMVHVNFDIQNPFDSDLTIEFIQSDAGLHGQIFAHFEQPFDDFVVPAHSTVNSGDIPNVLLTQGIEAALAIVPEAMLDLFTAQTVLIGNHAGYKIPWLQYQEPGVPTTYTISV